MNPPRIFKILNLIRPPCLSFINLQFHDLEVLLRYPTYSIVFLNANPCKRIVLQCVCLFSHFRFEGYGWVSRGPLPREAPRTRSPSCGWRAARSRSGTTSSRTRRGPRCLSQHPWTKGTRILCFVTPLPSRNEPPPTTSKYNT